MSVNQEQLKKLQGMLQKEYGSSLSEEDLLSEALRLSEFAKAVLRFSLSKNEGINIKNK